KPMYFLEPDREDHRGRLRAFYSDLVARAPGALARSQEGLVAALQKDTARSAETYATWRAVFNARGDRRAAARVAARLRDQGQLPRWSGLRERVVASAGARGVGGVARPAREPGEEARPPGEVHRGHDPECPRAFGEAR